MNRNILIFLVILALVVVQISFLNQLSSDIVSLNLILLFLVFIVFRLEIIPLLWWSLVVGFILDLFSAFPFGTTMIVTIITSLSLHFLFQNFLTNRSLYSFVLLTIIGTLIYNILFFLGSLIFHSLNLQNYYLLSGSQFWAGLFWQIILNSIIAFPFFLVIRFLSNRFQRRFLVTK